MFQMFLGVAQRSDGLADFRVPLARGCPLPHASFGRVPNLGLPQFLLEAQVRANGIRGASAGKGTGEAILRGNLLFTGPEEGD